MPPATRAQRLEKSGGRRRARPKEQRARCSREAPSNDPARSSAQDLQVTGCGAAKEWEPSRRGTREHRTHKGPAEQGERLPVGPDPRRQRPRSEGPHGADRTWNTGTGHGPQRTEPDQRPHQGIQGRDRTREGSLGGPAGAGKWPDGDPQRKRRTHTYPDREEASTRRTTPLGQRGRTGQQKRLRAGGPNGQTAST